MGGFAALPLVVEVAFGAEPLDTGTLTWVDVSDYVRRGTGVDFTRGWDPESDEPLPGRLTFTVNNETGDFTPGETGAFGEVRNRLPVRVSAVVGTGTGNALTYDEAVGWYDMTGATYDDAEIGTVVLWTGLVESWRISWENGVRSQVAVTAVDRWGAIRRLKFDGKFIERVVADQSPTNFWTFTAPTCTAGRVEPTVGTVTIIPGSAFSGSTGGTLNAPSVANPQTWLESAAATTSDGPGGSPVYALQQQSITASGTASVAFTVSGWLEDDGEVQVAVDGTAAPNGIKFSTSGGTYAVRATRAGGSATSQSGAAVAGWAFYAATISVDGAGAVTAKLYYNGALVKTDTTTWASGGWNIAQNLLILDAPTGVAYLATWNSALSDAQILAQYQAGTSQGVSGETAAVRAARLLTYTTPAPSLTTTGTFTATMSTQDLADKSLADALMECATAERGAIYMGTGGWPTLTSRSWRVGSSVAFTIPAAALSADVGWTLDDQRLTNTATVDRMVGDTSAGQVKARNDASVTTYGEQNKTLQVWLDTDAQLLERANAEANMTATARPRSDELTVDLLTKGATISAATLLAADIGQRIAVSGLPDEAPTGTQFYIEQIADRVTHTGWDRTFTVSLRADYFTVEDATYGQLDDVDVLAF